MRKSTHSTSSGLMLSKVEASKLFRFHREPSAKPGQFKIKNVLKIVNFTFLFFIFYFLFFIFYSGEAWAQNSFSLSIYPPLLEVLIKPGKAITQVYKIGNQSDKDIEVVSQVVPFKPADDQGNIQIVLDKAGLDKSVNWFSLQNADKKLNTLFQIKAEQSEELVLKIKVPKEAKEKDYYYSLIIKAVPQILSQGKTRATATGIIGANILLTVSQTEQIPQDLDISHFSLTNKFYLANLVDSFDSVGLKGIVKNNSRYFTKMEGEIIIKEEQGKIVKKLSLLPINVLAFSEREVVCPDSPGCQLPKRFLFGRYRATLAIKSRAGETEKSFYFYVLPVRATTLLVAFLLFILFVITFLRKATPGVGS